LSDPPEGGAWPGGAPEVAGGGEDRASALRVVAVALLLLILAAAGGLLVRPWETTIEPEGFLSEVFAGVDEPLPGGLVLDDARRLPTGERLVRYAAAESEGVVELTIVEVPASKGEQVLKDQLTGLRFESEGMGGGERRSGSWGGGNRWGEKKRASKLREKGTFPWHGYDADYARLWHGGAASGGGEQGAKEDASSYETVRVNLSTGGRCLLAYIRFADGVRATEEDAAAIVAGFRPVE